MRLLRGHEAKETADDDGGSVLEGAVVERLWVRKGGWALVVMDERGGALGLDLWRGTERARPGAHRAGRVEGQGLVPWLARLVEGLGLAVVCVAGCRWGVGVGVGAGWSLDPGSEGLEVWRY